MALVESVYRDTAFFPKDELFGLTTQIRRCAVSVPSNIAEGAARNSTREWVQFLSVACGSLAELETQLELAIRLGFMKADVISFKHADRVARLVRALRTSLKAKLAANEI
jgi:four helix bundle protein